MEAESESVHDVEVGQAVRVELGGNVGEHGVVVVAAHVAKGPVGAEADGDAVGGEGTAGEDGVDHLLEETDAVLGRTAVGVIASVGAGLEEGVEQIPIGGMDLDAVESGLGGQLGGTGVIGDGGPDVVEGHFRGRFGLDVFLGDGLGLRPAHGDGRGGGDGTRRGMEAGMRLTAHVPELHVNDGSLGMDAVGDLLPRGDLLGSADVRCVEPPAALLGDGRGLGDEKSARGALLVVLGHEVVGRGVGRAGVERVLGRGAPGAGHGGEADAVLDLLTADGQRLKELKVRRHDGWESSSNAIVDIWHSRCKL